MDMQNIYTQTKLRDNLNRKAIKERIPLNGTFELTPRCNMNCKMCYIRLSYEEMCEMGRERTAREWITMGRMCRDKGMLFLLLTGGEPFLRKDFKEIYTELNKMGLIMYINSNGTLITKETVEWLKKCPPAKINITMYGGSNETYKKLCNNPKGYDEVTQAIDRLLDAGINVGINASFTPDNINDMEQIYDFAKQRKIKVRPAIYMFPPRQREGGREYARFCANEAGGALFKTKKYELNDRGYILFLESIKKSIPFADENDECNYQADEHMGCMAGRSSFWITWNGLMTPCGMMNKPKAYPFEDGFASGWEKICEAVDEIFLPSECTHCKKRFACKVCGALTMAEGNGESTKCPTYLCGMTDEYLRLCGEQIKKENI